MRLAACRSSAAAASASAARSSSPNRLMSVCWLVLLKIEPIYDSGVQHTPIKYRGRLSWRPHLFPKAIAGLSSRHFSKLLDAASPRLLVAWSSVCQNTPEKCGQAWPGMGKRLMPRNRYYLTLKLRALCWVLRRLRARQFGGTDEIQKAPDRPREVRCATVSGGR